MAFPCVPVGHSVPSSRRTVPGRVIPLVANYTGVRTVGCVRWGPVMVAGGFTALSAAGVTASLLTPARVPLVDREELWGAYPRHALVLGAGGILGAAWEMGLITALARAGLPLAHCRLVVGTSAGSLVAALLRTGLHEDVLLSLARYGEARYQGRTVRLPGPVHDERVARERVHPVDVLTSPVRALAHLRVPHLAAAVSGVMPPSGFSLEQLADAVDLLWDSTRGPVRWPEDPTLLVSACLRDGQRVVFGAPAEPQPTLGRAVAASCAVPGALAPVTIAGRRYVDGAVVSMTNVDLALHYGADTVWVLHPLASVRTSRRPGVVGWGDHVVRARQAASLERAVQRARSRGVKVNVLSPSAVELAAFGERFMDSTRAPAVVDAALARTPSAQLLDSWQG